MTTVRSAAGDGIRPSACCSPTRFDSPQPLAIPERSTVRALERPVVRGREDVARGMVPIPGGVFQMGSSDADGFAADGEGPVRDVTVAPFRIDATAVSNVRFAVFAEETGYMTDAERFGWSFVFAGFIGPCADTVEGVVPGAPWWRGVRGASWRAPEGPGSSVADRSGHPAVHISWNDAVAYAAWAGKRLPTEAEWEMAARGGLVGKRFPWGDELTPGGERRCNIWQGEFPRVDTGGEGYVGTAPVDAFQPNGFGLYNMSGNVWEWCADWFSTDWHEQSSPATRVDPQGPPTGTTKVMRGGSHMCHASYCNRYRVAARTSNAPDSSAGHTGFRCVLPGL